MPTDDPAGEYASKAMEADTRREAVYWDLLFFVQIIVFESPGLLKEFVSEWVSWRVRLFRGTLPNLEEECRIKDCNSKGVAYLSDDKSWSEGRPACRRHYLFVKIGVYVIIGGILSALAATTYFVVMA